MQLIPARLEKVVSYFLLFLQPLLNLCCALATDHIMHDVKDKFPGEEFGAALRVSYYTVWTICAFFTIVVVLGSFTLRRVEKFINEQKRLIKVVHEHELLNRYKNCSFVAAKRRSFTGQPPQRVMTVDFAKIHHSLEIEPEEEKDDEKVQVSHRPTQNLFILIMKLENFELETPNNQGGKLRRKYFFGMTADTILITLVFVCYICMSYFTQVLIVSYLKYHHGRGDLRVLVRTSFAAVVGPFTAWICKKYSILRIMTYSIVAMAAVDLLAILATEYPVEIPMVFVGLLEGMTSTLVKTLFNKLERRRDMFITKIMTRHAVNSITFIFPPMMGVFETTVRFPEPTFAGNANKVWGVLAMLTPGVLLYLLFFWRSRRYFKKLYFK